MSTNFSLRLLIIYGLTIVGLSVDLQAMDGSDDSSPVFSYNYQSLAKPKNMGGMTWLRTLEVERNKADCLMNSDAFKEFSLEISATIGGKYGLSSRQATVEEQAELIYSITRTRHKFSGAKDILPRFYGVDTNEVGNLSPYHQAHLAAVLTIDTLATEAMGNEDLLHQWSEVKADQPINSKFIDGVKAHAKTWTKEPLVKTLELAIDSFLQNSKTIALAHDVFSMFAPKITLRTICSEMFNGEDRGWTVHGYSGFKSIAIDEDKKDTLSNLKTYAIQKFETKGALLCRSTVAELSLPEITEKLSLKPQTLVLEYPYNECFDELTCSFTEGKTTRYIWLTREVKHVLMQTLKHPYAKVSEKSLLDIYKYRASLFYKMRMTKSLRQVTNVFQENELKFLIDNRDIFAATLFERILSSKEYDMQKDTQKDKEKYMPKAIKLFKEIADLDDEFAKINLPIFLGYYGSLIFLGDRGVATDRDKGIELLRKAATLGNEKAKINLSHLLRYYGTWMLYGYKDVKIDGDKGIELLKESSALGNKQAKRQLERHIAY